MGAFLLAGGNKDKRFILQNGRILLHQPMISGILEGVATDLEIEANEIIRLRNRLYNILSRHTGQTSEKIEKDCDRNLWMEPEEAIQYGLADKIIEKAPEIVKDTNGES
jgi:ATP-dependent Clp protease protease subunit